MVCPLESICYDICLLTRSPLSLSLPLLSILVISPPSSSADVIKFPPPDLILGAGHLSSQLLLFTLHQGVVAVSQTSVLSSGSSTAATPSVTKTSRTVASSSRYNNIVVTSMCKKISTVTIILAVCWFGCSLVPRL